MKTSLLIVALLCAIFAPNIRSAIPSVLTDSPSKEVYQTVEHSEIRVTFLEMAQSQTPCGKYASTSFLFLVENTSKTDGIHSQGAPIRFYDEKNDMLFKDASNGLPKTASTVMNYQNRPHSQLPPNLNPADIEKTRLVRHSIATRIPRSVAAVEAEFGIDGNNKTYRFNLRHAE